MTRRKLIRILVPLVLALVLTLVIARLTTPPRVAEVFVVVASQSVPKGQVLTAKDLRLEQVPSSLALPGSISSLARAEGVVARVPLTAGDPVLADELQSTGAAGLPYRIPAGERAFSVQVNGVTGIAGNLTTGDMVDVLATFPAQSAQSSGFSAPARASVVVEDVAVLTLSSGGATQTPSAAGNGSPYTLVTLAVSPQQAAVISLSEQIGSVTFLLRPHTGAGSGKASVNARELP